MEVDSHWDMTYSDFTHSDFTEGLHSDFTEGIYLTAIFEFFLEED